MTLETEQSVRREQPSPRVGAPLPPLPFTDASADAPPSRAEFELLAAQVRRLAAQIAHGRA